jgi:hypothetical protein
VHGPGDAVKTPHVGSCIATIAAIFLWDSPHLSPAFVAKRRRGLGLQGLRPRPQEAYPGRYVEEADRA